MNRRDNSFYKTAAWLAFRREALLREPLCRHCKERGVIRPGHHVDHIVPISQGGEPYPGPEGVQVLCRPCHSQKTRADEGKRVRYGCDAQGNPLDPASHWR